MILTWKYVKPLKDSAAIEAFEKCIGVEFPADVVSCFQNYNGGRPDKKCFNTVVSSERVFKTLLSFNVGDPETITSAYDVVKKEAANLVPIASDPGGNFICYSVDSGIVLWMHETNKTEHISDTFTAFLESLY